jgi:hypothetical protein
MEGVPLEAVQGQIQLEVIETKFRNMEIKQGEIVLWTYQ